MNRQVVLEIGNTHVKAGLIEVSSLPIKVKKNILCVIEFTA